MLCCSRCCCFIEKRSQDGYVQKSSVINQQPKDNEGNVFDLGRKNFHDTNTYVNQFASASMQYGDQPVSDHLDDSSLSSHPFDAITIAESSNYHQYISQPDIIQCQIGNMRSMNITDV